MTSRRPSLLRKELPRPLSPSPLAKTAAAVSAAPSETSAAKAERTPREGRCGQKRTRIARLLHAAIHGAEASEYFGGPRSRVASCGGWDTPRNSNPRRQRRLRCCRIRTASTAATNRSAPITVPSATDVMASRGSGVGNIFGRCAGGGAVGAEAKRDGRIADLADRRVVHRDVEPRLVSWREVVTEELVRGTTPSPMSGVLRSSDE